MASGFNNGERLYNNGERLHQWRAALTTGELKTAL
jgi:hypothetical protein